MVRAPADGRNGRRQRVPRLKVVVPELARCVVSRPRLLDALDAATGATVLLVCAPAGWGKTVLLAEWARSRDAELAWVSLDSDDNDDRRFWSAVLDAVCARGIVAPGSPLRSLAVPPSPSDDPGFLADVVDGLDELPAPLWLVLDDLHEITATAPLRGLEALIRTEPSGLRLVLSSRRDPPLPLARMRLADQVAELRVEALRFVPDEADDLLDRAGVRLGDAQRRQLLEQTEGWAAGLRLAAMSLTGVDDPDGFLAGFARNDRAIAEFLFGEVLSGLSTEARDFLTAISVSEQVEPDLAAALSERPDAGVLLDELVQRTSLIARVGRQAPRYRMHALLRAQLLADLSRREPAHAAALHGVATDWFEAHGELGQAVTHASESGDSGRVAALLARHGVVLIVHGEHVVIQRGLRALSSRRIAEDATLAAIAAWVHLQVGEPALAEARLAHADAAWPADAPAELRLLRALVRACHAELAGDVDAMRKATDGFDAVEGSGLVLAPLAALRRATALLGTGRRTAASERARTALAAARAQGQDYVAAQCLTTLAQVAAGEGDYLLMGELAGEANGLNSEYGWQGTIAAAAAHVMLAYDALLGANPDECVSEAAHAAALVDAGTPPVNRGLYLQVETLQGIGEFELGEPERGARRIHTARTATEATRLPAQVIAVVAMLEHRAVTALTWAGAAEGVERWAHAAIPDSGEVRLLRARSLLAQGRAGKAATALQPVLNGEAPTVLAWAPIEAWVTASEIALRHGESRRAKDALARAVAHAERTGVRYPLVTAAAPVADLLREQRSAVASRGSFVEEVLAVRRRLHAAPEPVVLTDRERIVLRLLPTLRSLDEIADDLMVSPNTVKTHVRAIYSKLGVNRRRDAVAAATERGLVHRDARPGDRPRPPRPDVPGSDGGVAAWSGA